MEIMDGHFLTETHIEGELNITDISKAQRGTYWCRAEGLNEDKEIAAVEITYNITVLGDTWAWYTKQVEIDLMMFG